jgi:signal transduction histidine kinase
MKLTWKLFFSTFIVAILAFGVGGFILITLTFNAALERERESALTEAQLLRHTLQASVAPLQEWQKAPVQELVASVAPRFSSDQLQLRITGEGLKPVSSGDGSDTVRFASLPSLSEQATTKAIAHTIVREDAAYYLRTVQLVNLLDVETTVETSRDISAVFREREELFSIYQWLILGVAAVNGVLVFLLVRWTTAPIRQLSKATRSIARGRYSERIPVRSNDELGALTQDFNQMTESLEHSVNELEHTVNELELSVAREHDFVANFAHELKTPLTSIIGYADLLRAQRLSENNARLAANYIFSEGQRLESLSMKLLDLIVMQRRDFELRPVNLQKLLKSVRTVLLPIISNSGIELSIQAASTTVLCEPDLIKTLLLNLVDNACKATPRGGHVRVEGARLSERQYRIVVADDGAGIPPKDLPRITEAFYRADKSRSRAQGGVGLGLALCNEICALHGGTMAIDSTEGAGTNVSVVLKG